MVLTGYRIWSLQCESFIQKGSSIPKNQWTRKGWNWYKESSSSWSKQQVYYIPITVHLCCCSYSLKMLQDACLILRKYRIFWKIRYVCNNIFGYTCHLFVFMWYLFNCSLKIWKLIFPEMWRSSTRKWRISRSNMHNMKLKSLALCYQDWPRSFSWKNLQIQDLKSFLYYIESLFFRSTQNLENSAWKV